MYQVMYRCRMCQQIYPGVLIGDDEGQSVINALVVLSAAETTGNMLPNVSVTRLCPHRCYDGSIGMGDVIGVRFVQDTPVKAGEEDEN